MSQQEEIGGRKRRGFRQWASRPFPSRSRDSTSSAGLRKTSDAETSNPAVTEAVPQAPSRGIKDDSGATQRTSREQDETNNSFPSAEQGQQPEASSTALAAPSEPTVEQRLQVRGDFWRKAYDRVTEKPSLQEYITEYEAFIFGNNGQEGGLDSVDIHQRLGKIVNEEAEKVEKSRCVLVLFGRRITVDHVVEKIIGGVLYAKDLVGAVISDVGEPHLAVAWIGVCLLLPVSIAPPKSSSCLTIYAAYRSPLNAR